MLLQLIRKLYWLLKPDCIHYVSVPLCKKFSHVLFYTSFCYTIFQKSEGVAINIIPRLVFL